MKKLILPLLAVLSSCTAEPIAKFYVIGFEDKVSSIVLYDDSTYIQDFTEMGQISKDTGFWKGSYAPDSTLVTYEILEDGSWLGALYYTAEHDTLQLKEWTIR
jgi:hypothetical protein